MAVIPENGRGLPLFINHAVIIAADTRRNKHPMHNRGECAMRVDRKWVERNLGFDPIAKPPPLATFAFKPAAKAATSEDFQREIIDFDSESPAGLQFLAFTTATGLSRYTDVPWPKELAPKTGPKPRRGSNSPLPRADVLVVTWTVDEGHALSRVLTPGKDSRNDYLSYTHNFAAISKKMRNGLPGAPGEASRRLLDDDHRRENRSSSSSRTRTCRRTARSCRTSTCGARSSRKCSPKLVITTGTAGGIGKQFEVGDVIVSPIVRFDCTAKFKKQALRAGALHEHRGEDDAFRHGALALQGERAAAAEGQHAPAQDRPGARERR